MEFVAKRMITAVQDDLNAGYVHRRRFVITSTEIILVILCMHDHDHTMFDQCSPHAPGVQGTPEQRFQTE